MLLYTGQRKEEVRSLVWGDLHLDGNDPFALFRASTTKDKDKRTVPLLRPLAALLREMRPTEATPSTKVFLNRFPTFESLIRDFKRAKIDRVDRLGHVVHFHSFRKTWQTLGANNGVNQRAAQEILGHSDANLTAKVYTDIPALGLRQEIEKFPWILGPNHDAAPCAHDAGAPGPSRSLPVILAELIQFAKQTPIEEFSHALAPSGTEGQYLEKMVGPGFEPGKA
jgi:integrase